MIFPRPLAYPLLISAAVVVVCLAWIPFADPDQLSALAVVVAGIVGYTAYRVAVALGRPLPKTSGPVTVRRVRQQYRLLSRSWLELDDGERKRHLPVYFDPALIGLVESEARIRDGRIMLGRLRIYPAGRIRQTEPPGRLIDNPSRPFPDATQRAAAAVRIRRRLLLDAQPAVAAPFAGLLWVYVVGGGAAAFVGASCVAAAATVWLSAIRGSDPS